jgi:transcriptional regulator with XRE-family HTH domain
MRRGEKMTIGNELKAILEKEGISGYRLSKKSGIDETYLNKLLHNKINPTYLTLKRIGDALGYQVHFQEISQGREAKPTRLKGKRRK